MVGVNTKPGQSALTSTQISAIKSFSKSMSIAFTYQWLRDNVAINGATSLNYTVQTADLGHVLTLQVTGTTATGVTVAISAGLTIPASATAPANTVAPTINEAAFNLVSTCLTGTWAGTTPITYTYQWYVGGAAVFGATSSTYTPILADVGKSLYCTVTATNSVGSSSANTNLLTVTNPSPSPSPQYPTLLNRYLARSPLLMPGVDFYVGANPSTVFQDPLTYTFPTGASLDTLNHLIRVDGNNVSLSNLDLSLSGGWMVYYTGTNIVLNNCYYKNVGTNVFLDARIESTGGTITNCTIDGNAANGVFDGLLSISGNNTWTIHNNWFKDTYTDFVQFDSSSPSVGTMNIQNNLFDNVGAGRASGTHPDVLQCFGTANYTVVWNNNTWRQTEATWGGQGVSCQDNTLIPVCQSAQYNNNTFALSVAGSGGGGVSYAVIVDTSELVTTAQVQGNYVDPTGINFGFLLVRNDGGGGHSGTVNASGNINMLTGGSIT